ncbi:MAG: HAD family phosphatase [Clostridia bacterium]|nr:HAD family phosphatase [Clostridia bacterium]
MDYKFAVFDLDGTIVDSMKYWRGLPFAFLNAQYGYKDFPEKAVKDVILADCLNYNWKDTSKYLNERYGYPEVEIDRPSALDMMNKFYSTVIDFKPFAREFLEKLQKEGVKCSIATATPQREVNAVLERLGISHYFKFVLTTEEVGRGKYHPDIFDKSLELHGPEATKENTMVFEDAVYSIRTLRKHGYRVTGIEDYCEREQDEVKALSEKYIKSYEEIL